MELERARALTLEWMPSEAPFRTAIQDFIEAHAKPVEKYSHQPRLYALSQQIGKGLAYDDDVVFAAAWLHDLGVFVGHRPEDPEQLAAWDSVGYACAKAPEVLKQCGFPVNKIEPTVEAIRTHQPGADPQSVEGTVLRDADILEQLGSVGILRAVCKIGRDTRYRTFADVIPVLRQAVERLPGQLRLAPARKMALARIEVMQHFLAGAESESGGLLD